VDALLGLRRLAAEDTLLAVGRTTAARAAAAGVRVVRLGAASIVEDTLAWLASDRSPAPRAH
jgi:uroporphyrinogen-III synthase